MLIFFADYTYAVALQLISRLRRLPANQPIRDEKHTLIFIPGMYENRFYFSTLVKNLDSRNYNLVYADTLVRMKGSILEQSEKINSIIIQHNLKHVTLIGHSSGGLVGVYCLAKNSHIVQLISIATPFSGVHNGHLVRSQIAKELLPNSATMTELKQLYSRHASRIISVFPRYDNQVWNKKGSRLKGAKNIQLDSRGHHLILRDVELSRIIQKLI